MKIIFNPSLNDNLQILIPQNNNNDNIESLEKINLSEKKDENLDNFNLEQKKKVRKNTNTQSGVGAGPAPPAPTSSSSDKIYPELRKVESKRFAIKLKDSLDKTNLVGDVRVTPDATASGEIYILGKINESDATEVSIDIQVVDVSGRLLISR